MVRGDCLGWSVLDRSDNGRRASATRSDAFADGVGITDGGADDA
jgi:hypothetical protein